jgi:hypothetical protein
MSKISKMS